MKELLYSIFVCGAVLLQGCSNSNDVVLYVSPDGNDTNNATISAPLKTLEGAKQRLIFLAKNKQFDTAYIKFANGTYRFDKCVLLDKKVAKCAKRFVLEGQTKAGVVFHGGKTLDASALQLVKDADVLKLLPPEKHEGKLYEIDIAKHKLNVGEFFERGYGADKEPTLMEVFVDGVPQNLSRYPNGEALLEIGEVLEFGNRYLNGKKAVFRTPEGFTRAQRWKDAEIFLTGSFNFGYTENNLKVLDFDLKTGTFTTNAFMHGVYPGKQAMAKLPKGKLPLPAYPSVNFRGWAVFNMLEEIDKNGEYFIDSKRNKIFIMLADTKGIKRLDFSELSEPFIKLQDINNVELKNIDFAFSRANGVELERVNGVKVDACKFFNLGMYGMKSTTWLKNAIKVKKFGMNTVTFDVFNLKVDNSHFENLGCGGIMVGGGDIKTLTPSGHEIRNSFFKRTTRIDRTYAPGIWFAGFGGVAENNTFVDIDHSAVQFDGCEFKIRRNYFYDVCKRGMDQGAVYSGRNVYYRGNVIEENFFNKISPDCEHHVHAVYIDDCEMNVLIRRNIFCNAGAKKGYAINFNKGIQNKVIENLFIDCNVVISEWDLGNLRENKKIFIGLEKESRDRFGGDSVIKLYNERYPSTIDVLNQEPKTDIRGNMFYGTKSKYGKDRLTKYLKDGKGAMIEPTSKPNVKEWSIADVKKYFGNNAVVKEMTSIKYGCDKK